MTGAIIVLGGLVLILGSLGVIGLFIRNFWGFVFAGILFAMMASMANGG